MVEVFKTNVAEVSMAKKLLSLLTMLFPDKKINFDLDDCDKILRVEGENLMTKSVISLVNDNGYNCIVLD